MNITNDQNFSIAHLNDASKLNQLVLSTNITFTLDLCFEGYFDPAQSMKIIQELNKLKDSMEYFQFNNHPSIPKMLCDIGNLLAETSLSHKALPFFKEQLRIEKYYLGCQHPDLADVLFSIGKIYEKNDQLIEGKKYFMEAFSLLNNHKRKGQLYASLIYNIGLVNFRQTLYRDAFESFDLAITEHCVLYGDFHPAVAEVRMKVGTFQLDIGKLQDAMKNFLEALVIIRMAFGNDHFKVAQCLYGIGLIHEAKAEFSEALDVFSQSLSINENTEDDCEQDDDDDTFSLVILHRIGLIYQSIEDMDRAFKVFDNLRNLIKLRCCDVDAENKLLNTFGLNMNNECVQAAAAA